MPDCHRLRSSIEFSHTVRRGVRVARPTVVVHAWQRPDDGCARVGFIVSKAVGGAVLRNRVKRRLRALVRPLLVAVPPGCSVVVRALPPAAGSAGLGPDVSTAWALSVGRARRLSEDKAAVVA